MPMLPAIVLSSHNTGLGVIRALGSKGVPIVSVYYQKSDMGYVSKYVGHRIFAPHPEHRQEEFIALLMDWGEKNGRAVVIPADDGTLAAISRHKQVLERHFLVACPDWNVVRRIIDKRYTYAVAEAIGIQAPKTVVPQNYEEMEAYGRSIEYPCLVKPCESHRYFEIFRRKMVRADNFQQLAHAYRQASDAGLDVVLQEFIPGDDSHGVNYNSYFRDGAPLVEFTAAKVRLSPPYFGVPSVVISREIGETFGPGRQIIKALGFNGFSCTEFKRDPRDGVYKLMEVNGRHNRSVLLAVKCGINFPWLEYQHLTTGAIPAAASCRQSIYWIDEFRDTYRFLGQCRKKSFPLIRQLRPYVNKHVCAVFDHTDPAPFLKRCIDILRSTLPSGIPAPAPATPSPPEGVRLAQSTQEDALREPVEPETDKALAGHRL